MVYLLYGTVLAAAFPFVLLYLLWRGLKDRRYFSHITERFGRLPISKRTSPGAIWLHAVSVGEILSSIELLKELRIAAPSVPLYVSTTTLAGRAMAEEKLAGLADLVFFVPMDFRFAVRKVLRAIRPSLVVVMETEIWPNLYRQPKLACCALAVVNGRISDRALPSYKRMAWFFRAALLQPDRIWVQSQKDRARYLELGAPPDRVIEGGNLKFDFNPAAKPIAEDLQKFIGNLHATIWIAASTMPPLSEHDVDEDDVVIRAFQDLAPMHPNLLLILVPRRPERFESAATKLANAGKIRFVRRSQVATEELILPGVLLLDSMGELSSLFEIADVVFMGGTLAERGGHNILEPAYFSKPVIVGPHMENFAAIHALFRAGGGLKEIRSADQLGSAVARLLDNPAERRKIGILANQAASTQKGVAKKRAKELIDLQVMTVPHDVPHGLERLLLAPLAKIWGAFARTPDGARALSTPVISIGGITMGGTGKTPMAIWLADRIRAQGLQPAILTRGYHRETPHEEVIIPAGRAAPTELTGDEAQIFVRRGIAHLGIDSDRYRAGRRVEELLKPDVFILDDGFQHRKLKRDADLVLIDTLDPFGGGEVFPLGRLREPLENLSRATAFVLTRAQPGKRTDGIEAILRHHNPHAPIFRSWVVGSKWRGGKPSGRVAAFCGLANPNTFWRVLKDYNLDATERWIYEDHHKYSFFETQRMARQTQEAGIEYLVTTEKDYVNVPEAAFKSFTGVKLCWLEIEVKIDDEAKLLEYVRKITIRTDEAKHKFL
ncbi:MAG TPA: tetraacyldisaccharide 4'-kinase [Bryobacteraceae bacterium]